MRAYFNGVLSPTGVPFPRPVGPPGRADICGPKRTGPVYVNEYKALVRERAPGVTIGVTICPATPRSVLTGLGRRPAMTYPTTLGKVGVSGRLIHPFARPRLVAVQRLRL